MFSQAVFTAALTLPILSTCTHNILNPSDAFFFDQLPGDAYDNDPTVAKYKEKIYLRKDINYLDPEDGPYLTCLPNGQVKLDFANETKFKLDELAIQKLLGHPIIIPHGYDSSSCPELADHTIFGPRQSVPKEALADLEADGIAVMKAISEDDVQEKEITLSVDWVTYHELIGVVGNAPEELPWLAQGVLPFSDSGSSSTGSRRIKKRIFGGILAGLGRVIVGGVASGAAGWALDQFANGIRR